MLLSEVDTIHHLPRTGPCNALRASVLALMGRQKLLLNSTQHSEKNKLFPCTKCQAGISLCDFSFQIVLSTFKATVLISCNTAQLEAQSEQVNIKLLSLHQINDKIATEKSAFEVDLRIFFFFFAG